MSSAAKPANWLNCGDSICIVAVYPQPKLNRGFQKGAASDAAAGQRQLAARER
jgi:hypothetical protein